MAAQHQNDEQIAVSWHRFYGNKDKDDSIFEENRWAFDVVRSLAYDRLLSPQDNIGIVDDPARLWTIILKLLEISPSRQGLISVAAEPLRKLLDGYFEEYIDEIEALVKANGRLSFALSHVYIDNPERWQTVRKLANRAARLNFDASENSEHLDKLKVSWLAFQRSETYEVREQNRWALSELEELIDIDPLTAWKVNMSLLEQANTNDELLDIGQNLSQLLHDNFSAFKNEVLESIPKNKRLVFSLQEMTSLDSESSTDWAELQIAIRENQDSLFTINRDESSG